MGSIAPDPNAERLVHDVDELAELFRAAEKPRESWRIGAEAEKFGVSAVDGRPIAYEGPRGVLRVFRALSEAHGWLEESELPGGPIISLKREHANITLEPGAQLELSGAPSVDVHSICAELRGHMAELREITSEMDLLWLAVGFHPLARQDDLIWVPKQRYAVMRSYLPTKGSAALDMMRRTCTVQANLDYSDERDAMRKLRVSLVFAPLVAAMCANSPFYEGKISGKKSLRGEVWLDMDPARSGLIPSLWGERELGYRDYVEWALDAGMFLFWRDGQVVANTGQTFRDFMRDGFQGHRAQFGDWKLHIQTLFPEARLKTTLEERPCDALPADLRCAIPALYAGLLYDERALGQAEALAATLSYEDVSKARPELVRVGLGASIGQRSAADLAGELHQIAMGGLERRARLDARGLDERIHLKRLADLNAQGLSPADRLLEGLGPDDPDLIREILARTQA